MAARALERNTCSSGSHKQTWARSYGTTWRTWTKRVEYRLQIEAGTNRAAGFGNEGQFTQAGLSLFSLMNLVLRKGSQLLLAMLEAGRHAVELLDSPQFITRMKVYPVGQLPVGQLAVPSRNLRSGV